MIGGNYMAKTITFKDGADLDRIDALLSGTRLRNRMPQAIRGNRSKMTLWAIEYLTKLVDGGVDNLQSELFTNNSEEWEVITRENDRLKAQATIYKQAMDIIHRMDKLQQGVFQIETKEDGSRVITLRHARPLTEL